MAAWFRFSTNWFGNYIPPATGVYYFRYTSDDGIRLFFQGIRQPEVSNQWGTHVREPSYLHLRPACARAFSIADT